MMDSRSNLLRVSRDNVRLPAVGSIWVTTGRGHPPNRRVVVAVNDTTVKVRNLDRHGHHEHGQRYTMRLGIFLLFHREVRT